MALDIQTFTNATGGNAAGGASLFKALGHPLTAERVRGLLKTLKDRGPVAVYDPRGQFAPFLEFYPVDGLDIAGVYVQDIERIGEKIAGCDARPVTEIESGRHRSIFVAAFDSARPIDHIAQYMDGHIDGRIAQHIDRKAATGADKGADVYSLDDARLPAEMLTRPGAYLDPLNFATNFAFFRDSDGRHTRIATVNYWHRYGGRGLKIWARLFGRGGETLAEWTDPAPDAAAGLRIDSKDVRRRFGLGPFEGQLFLHVIGAAGHDVVKYALDLYGDDPSVLSCTHDANAWPAELYAGLPAPRDGEEVVLWVQNSHPCPIPANGVGLNAMGREDVAWLDRELPPFASAPVNVADLLPDLRYPDQIEIRAGKYFVRPRYEIRKANGRARMAHANVERTDLKPDPNIRSFGALMGRGFVLPAPVLPCGRFSTSLLPTPMSTCQTTLPVGVTVFGADGDEKHYRSLGCLKRDESVWLDLDDILQAAAGPDNSPDGDPDSGPEGRSDDAGHVELSYDFSDGGEADGWLHAVFRYEDRASGHAAETSFGAHIFNHILTYRGEPQSYAGPAPGLSTRLFLRLGDPPFDTMCHLINPAAADWGAPASATVLRLHRADGEQVAEREIRVPRSGSAHFRYSGMFSAAERKDAGSGAYAIVRDLGRRLFGYHGLLNDGLNGGESFSLDHMFGF